MKNKTEIVLELPSSERQNIISALEKESASNKRCVSKIFIKNDKLIIKIEAEDIIALRAVVNSYLRYLQIIENVESAEL